MTAYIVSRYLEDGSREYFAGIEDGHMVTRPIIFFAHEFDNERDAGNCVTWLTLTQGLRGFGVSQMGEVQMSKSLRKMMKESRA